MSAAVALTRLSIPAQLAQPSVPSEVAGRCEVEVKALAALLGRAAWRVWECLIHWRDREGVTHATRLGIANAHGFEVISDKEVKRGLTRLRQAGLIVDRGWASRMVPSRVAGHVIAEKVYERVVLGARIESSSKAKMAVVPKATRIWMSSAHTWGGRRAGAGRKRRKLSPRRVLELLQGGRSAGSAIYSKKRVTKLTIMGTKHNKEDVFQVGPPISVKRRAPAGSLSSSARFAGLTASPLSAPKLLTKPKPLTRTVSLKSDGAEIVLTPGARRSSAPLQIRAELLPPPPWDLDLPMIKIPSPPLLDSSLGTLRRRSFIARFWRSAYISRFGSEDSKAARACFARGPKISRAIDQACEEFIELGLAPGSWMVWCFDLSLNFDWGPANPWWVIRATFMRKHFEWYRETASIEGSKVIMTDAHRELWTRWHAMNKAARFALSISEVKAIVEKHLSFDEHDRLVALAHIQAADKQKSYTRLARSGDIWIW